MANCKNCGKKLGFMDGMDPYCVECYSILGEKLEEIEIEKFQKAQEAERIQQEKRADELIAIENVLLTTEGQLDIKIKSRLAIVTAECAFGMNVFRDLFAGVRNIVGGRSEAMQKTMRDARDTVLYELKCEAYRIGGNAVVGVDLDYVDLSGAGTMVMLVASGTAVVVEDLT